MGKLHHYHEDNTAYFITTVTHNRQPIFNDSLACDLLVTILTYHKHLCNYSIYGFIIMPDHLHIIIQPHYDASISAVMKRIKASFSRFYNKRQGLTGTVWQQGFYDKGIRDRAALDEALRYMHNNPIRKELVRDATEYTYSSCSFYERGDQRFALLLHNPKW